VVQQVAMVVLQVATVVQQVPMVVQVDMPAQHAAPMVALVAVLELGKSAQLAV